jgi:hypothetical protein
MGKTLPLSVSVRNAAEQSLAQIYESEGEAETGKNPSACDELRDEAAVMSPHLSWIRITRGLFSICVCAEVTPSP